MHRCRLGLRRPASARGALPAPAGIESISRLHLRLYKANLLHEIRHPSVGIGALESSARARASTGQPSQ